MTKLLRLLCLLMWFGVANAQVVATEVRNGSFEQGGLGWIFGGIAKVTLCESAPHGKHALQCTDNGDVAVQVVIAEPASQYAVSVYVRTEKVKPLSGAGYAYAAIYEYDFHGNLLAFHDFVQLTGTSDWKKFSDAWKTHPRAFYFEVRLGLYNAQGVALFDAVQVTHGEKTPEQYSEPTFVKGNWALILHEPSFPENPAAPSPKVLAKWLKEAGYEPQTITAKEISDEGWVIANQDRISLLVLPNSPYFPVEAHRNLLRLLIRGVDLLTFGGYAFDFPMQRTDSGYRPIEPEKSLRIAPEKSQALKVNLLNANPDFETVNPDGSVEGWERSHPQQCFVTEQFAKIGKKCAAVQIPDELGSGTAIWRTSVNVKTADRLRISGWLKTENVKGEGYAFIAYYPFAGNREVNPRDIAQVRGNSDWQYFSEIFVVPYGVDRVEIRFGIYNATGKAFFDSVKLELIEMPPRINTRHGEPRDGLGISPLQITMFDAHHPLRDAVRLEAEGWSWTIKEGQITGYSATGALQQSARWKPIVVAYDRSGRECGTVGAVMHHYAGTFAGSSWVFFGVDNIDLTKLPQFCEQVLLPLLHNLNKGISAQEFKSELPCYRPNEPIIATLRVNNRGSEKFDGWAEFELWSIVEGAREGKVLRL